MVSFLKLNQLFENKNVTPNYKGSIAIRTLLKSSKEFIPTFTKKIFRQVENLY